MQVGCYLLDLYCDNPAHKPGGYSDAPHYQYSDEHGSRCRRMARKHGWRWSSDAMVAVCPECTKAGITVKDVEEALESK